MNKIAFVLAVAGSVAASGVANVNAQSANSYAGHSVRVTSPASDVPSTAFFIGLGGSYNAVRFGTQNVFAMGTSDVFQNGVLASSGSASGPAAIDMSADSTLGFSVQGGYFQKFSNSDLLWGAKFAYSYLGATATVRNALLPQTGSFTATGSTTPVPFTGNALVQSFKTNMIQQMTFVPFIGRSFEKSFIYIGAGPTLSQTRTGLGGLIGFADINGTRTDVSGSPINLSNSGWVYGGAAVVGATYFFDRSWFLDVSYTFAMTTNRTANFSSPFTNPNGSNGSTITGTLVGTSSAKEITQAVAVTLNRAF
jgi:hypothetical protein